MQNNKVIYSCITGNYDEVPVHDYVDDSWDYLLYTDNNSLLENEKIHHWKIRKLEFAGLDSTRNARFHKLNPHLLFPEYKYSLWLDGNINIKRRVYYKRVESFIAQKEKIVVPKHYVCNCSYDEALELKAQRIDYKKIIDAEIEFLEAEKFPHDIGLYDTSMIFREHNDNTIISAQELWWQMLVNYSRRDQLSFVYSFWKYEINILPMYSIVGYNRFGKEVEYCYSKNHNQHRLSEEEFNK